MQLKKSVIYIVSPNVVPLKEQPKDLRRHSNNNREKSPSPSTVQSNQPSILCFSLQTPALNRANSKSARCSAGIITMQYGP